MNEETHVLQPKKIGGRIKKYLKEQKPYFVILLFIIASLFVFYFEMMFISIKPGEQGVLWRRFGGGTVVEKTYDEGLHIIWPFDKMYIYSIRKQKISDTIRVLTVNGLTIEIEYAVIYFPNYSLLPMLHQRVGPDYPSTIIFPEVRSVIRTVIGQNRPEDIYTAQKLIQARISALSKTRLESRFIDLDYVPIERISLPVKISDAIESKLAQQQLSEEYEFRLDVAGKEAERKKVEAVGISSYNTIIEKSIDQKILDWQGIVATRELATSNNAKVVVIGAGEKGLPLILGQ
ncbi:prohibitin family protein [Sulfurospirillum barnesii]|uniref:Membrane protease subunit, stomatin/prohibitin n=1 Tax=Sulfurospirillum barnesii (strain ATCC 700032 / DSM 10660 / SES-3) TaxID=760154 RepID=I3XVS7_SULBS|nr:prohibitin family protein [Sulfurospirillum barnesii]AFL68051.1 membrane protease subunit, stomatin/prohibitin [Sulfurospirillum barnesii SES-3]